METLSDQFSEIVASRLKALKTNAFAVEQAHGLPADAIRNVLRSDKKIGPTLSRAEEICHALGLQLSIRPRGEVAQAFAEPSFASQFVLGRRDWTALRWHENIGISHGPPVTFAADWLHANGIDPKTHVCVPVGVLPDAARTTPTLAIIDPSAERRGGPALWALAERTGRIGLVALQIGGGRTMLLPTKDEPAIRFLRGGTSDPNLLGRVLWSGASAPGHSPEDTL